MPLFECGGSTLLQNKQAIAKPSTDTIYKASDDGYDGYEQVTVPKFATLGAKSITTNGNNQSVISGNNSYSSVNVNVPKNSDDPSNYVELFNGSVGSGGNYTINYNATNYINQGYNYIVIYATNSYWTNPSSGTSTSGPTLTNRSMIPLGTVSYGGVGFYTDISGFSRCYAIMPYYITTTQIILCPSSATGLPHLGDSGQITKVRLVR